MNTQAGAGAPGRLAHPHRGGPGAHERPVPPLSVLSAGGGPDGPGEMKLWASCCGHKEVRPYLTRTQDQAHRSLLALAHRDHLTCPWCGREVTAIDLAKAKGRKSLRHYETAVVLHARGDALYADALALRKEYRDEDGLTARPEAWCSSGYYFARGEVMQADHQLTDLHGRPSVTWSGAGWAGGSWYRSPSRWGISAITTTVPTPSSTGRPWRGTPSSGTAAISICGSTVPAVPGGTPGALRTSSPT